MNEGDPLPDIPFGINRIEEIVAEIHAVEIGFEDDPVSAQRIEGVPHFDDGSRRVGQRRACEEAQAAGIRACSDPDDDVFLDCSQAAQAHFLVTGNLKHFSTKLGEH